jgi:WD40 repeat protein/serine/threonine protein kinase
MMRTDEEVKVLKDEESSYVPQAIHSVVSKITTTTSVSVSENLSSQLPEREEENISSSSFFIGVNRLPVGSVIINREKLLESNAFGQVWEGQWREQRVALKEIDIEHKNFKDTEKQHLPNEVLEERLQWEVARLSTLSHPNLLQFYGLYKQENKTYLVMKFCEGESLQNVLEKKTELDWSLRWQWALEIAQGVAYLHQQGILHRHLKAENVLLGKDNRVYLTGFGVQIDDLLGHSESKVVTEGFQGDYFIAPEILQSQPSTAASDIYALGLVFWQLATQGKKPGDLFQLPLPTGASWEHEPIPSDCPLGIKELILDCWQPDAIKRPTAKQVVERLNQLGAQFHPKADWIKLCEKIDELIHSTRYETLKYISPYVTRHQVMEDLDTYWRRLENQTSQEEPEEEFKESQEEIKISREQVLMENEPSTLTTTLEEFKEPQEEIKICGEQMLKKNEPLILTAVLEEFLQTPEPSTLVLLGEAGLGKTLSTYHLADKLLSNFWKHLRDPEGTTPYYPLMIRPLLVNWSYSELNNILNKVFRRLEFSLTETERQQAPWLIIIDGYDECQLDMEPGNLAKHLGLEHFPNAKLLVTCRPNTVKTSELADHFALNGNLVVRHFLPFNVSQMFTYLKERLCWDSNIQSQYQQKLEDAHSLRAALRSPFVLSLLVQSWETVSQKDFNQLNRWQIYEGFVQHWINTSEFLLSQTLKNALKGRYSTLLESFNAFAADVAFKAFQKKSISLDVKTTTEYLFQHESWFNLREQVIKDSQKNFVLRQEKLSEKIQSYPLLSEQDYSQIMLSRLQQFERGSPLKNKVLFFDFMHKSFFEYFVARRILQLKTFQEGLELLNYHSIQTKPEVLEFIREGWRIYPSKVLEEALFNVIEHSRQNVDIAQSAANAMTILNLAKVSFSGRDLRGVCIPGADLTNAILDNTNLENADLTGVTLCGAWMHNTNFKNAQLKDVLFGEYPTLFPETVSMCSYSPDGRILAVAGNNIQLFDTSSRVLVRTLYRVITEARPQKLANRIYGLGEVPDLMTCISFSPNGQYLASGSGGGAVKLWDVATGECLKTFEGHIDPIQSLSFSPDGQFIASSTAECCEDDDQVKLRIWNVRTSECLMFEGRPRTYSVCFSPDGQLLASSSDHGVELWSAATGTCLRKMSCDAKVFGVIFSPDGRILAAGGKDNAVKLWDVKTGVRLKTLKGHTDWVSSISFHPTDSLLVSGSYDHSVKFWDITTGLCLKTLEGHTGSVKSVSFSPDGQRVVSGSSDKSVKFWDASNLSYKGHILEGRITSIASMSFPDGVRIATGNDDNTVKLWDGATGRCLKTLKGHIGHVESLSFSPDGKLIASADNKNKEVKLWSVFTGECLRTLESSGDYISFSSSGQLITSGHWGVADAKFWDVRRGTLLNALEWHTQDVGKISVSADKQLIASTGKRGSVKLWDATGKHLKTLEGHTDEVDALCFSPNGELIASVSHETTITLWNVITGVCLKKLENCGEIRCINFSPDGQLLASGSKDGQVKLWDTMTGVCLKVLESHADYVNSISFSPDGKLMASAGFIDHIIKLWNVATGACLNTLEAPYQGYVSFSPCGQRLASGGSGSILLWDITTGKCLKSLAKHGDMCSLAFSPDGEFIASGGYDFVDVWDASTGEYLKKLEGRVYATFSSDGQLITLGGTYGMFAKVWDLATGICLKTLEWRGADVKSVSSSPDGQIFVSASQRRMSSSAWDIVTGECLKTLEGSGQCLSFSSGEKCIASGGGERGTMNIWSATGKYLRTLEGHTGDVNDINISSNGHRLISVSEDQTIRVWDTRIGTCLKVLKGHSADIYGVTCSPDGQYLASGSGDNTLRLWSLNSAQSDYYLINLIYATYSLTFAQSSGNTFLISGHDGGRMCYWQVMNLNNKPYLQLLWSNAQNVLMAQHANIEGAKGLSKENADLLKQRGAFTKETLTAKAALLWQRFLHVSSSNENTSRTENKSSGEQSITERRIPKAKVDCRIS